VSFSPGSFRFHTIPSTPGKACTSRRSKKETSSAGIAIARIDNDFLSDFLDHARGNARLASISTVSCKRALLCFRASWSGTYVRNAGIDERLRVSFQKIFWRRKDTRLTCSGTCPAFDPAHFRAVLQVTPATEERVTRCAEQIFAEFSSKQLGYQAGDAASLRYCYRDQPHAFE